MPSPAGSRQGALCVASSAAFRAAPAAAPRAARRAALLDNGGRTSGLSTLDIPGSSVYEYCIDVRSADKPAELRYTTYGGTPLRVEEGESGEHVQDVLRDVGVCRDGVGGTP